MKNGTKGQISTGFFFQLNSHNPDNERTSAITPGNSNKQTCHAVNQKDVPARNYLGSDPQRISNHCSVRDDGVFGNDDDGVANVIKFVIRFVSFAVR